MGVYTIKTPDGKTMKVEGPDGASDNEIIAFAQSQLKGGKFGDSRIAINRTGAVAKPKADLQSTALQGLTLGGSDEIMGGVGVLADAVAAPFSDRIDFNPGASYEAWRDQERARIAETRKAYPWSSTATEFGAGLLTGGTAARGALQGAGVSRGVLNTAAQGAKAAAPYGALGGFLYGEGANNSIAGAGLGAALAAGLGGALPIAFQLGAKPIQTAINYLRPQNGIGRELFVKAARDDGLTPNMIAERIMGAQQRGVPLAPADLGENLRGLTGAVSRQPGPARRLVRSMLAERQAGQGERVRSAIERDLGPIGNINDASEALTRRANAEAAPLYDEARQQPVISTPELEALLATPAGRQALSQARTIAQNERRDPTALGFALDEEGNVVLNPTLNIAEDGSIVQEAARQRGYTLDTIDLVKRGLDAVLEPNRNPVTRRLDLAGNPLAQSQASVRSGLLSEADRLNPSYARARAAFADPARQRTALEQGGKMVNATAEEVERATLGLNPSERGQYALGYRSQLAENLERRVTGGDKVNALIGTPRKQRALGQLFGDEANFPRFSDTLGDEALANETYRSVMTGSPTANRLADDAAVSDDALVEDLGGKALKGVANGGWAAGLIELGNGLRNINRFGAGATGVRARDQAAALLSEIDPVLFGQGLREGLRQQALRRVSDRAVRRRVRNAGMFGGRALGGVSAYGLRPLDD